MVKYTGINHLAMATRDMDTTLRFWRDLLGMRLVAGLGRPGYRHYFFQEGPEPQPGHWPQITNPTPAEERMVYPGEGMVLAEKGDS